MKDVLRKEIQKLRELEVITYTKDAEIYAAGFIAGMNYQRENNPNSLSEAEINEFFKVASDTYRNSYYFVCGNDESFPYPGGYVIVRAKNLAIACDKYRERFPHENRIVNCAEYYTESQWKLRGGIHFEGIEPSEIIL